MWLLLGGLEAKIQTFTHTHKQCSILHNIGICFSYNDPSMTTSNYELWQVLCARSVLFLKNFYYVCFILELLEIQCTMIIKKTIVYNRRDC